MVVSTQTISDVILPRPQSRSLAIGRDIFLVLLASGLLALTAQISIILPFSPVPFTGQTFGVLLIGAALGWKRGGLAVLAYLTEGFIGLPFFAGGLSGISILTGYRGGYLIGFIGAAMLVGYLAERGWDRTPWMTAFAMILGNLVIYLCGVSWLAYYFHISFIQGMNLGMYPFLLWDTVKLAVAITALPSAWSFVKHNRHQ
jgi:biotin transport system substrate-specific component